MRAWYMDNDTSNKCTLHQRVPNEEVQAEELRKIGVKYWYFNPETEFDKVNEFCNQQEYQSRDEVKISADFPQEKLDMFYTEHLHEDEEIRYVLNGSGFFDVRSKNDEWIRIYVNKGDLIVLPAGIHHRFTLDEQGSAHVARLFKNDPKWTAINRTSELHPAHAKYLASLSS